MKLSQILDRLERDPVIAAIRDDRWQDAIASPAQVLFYLSAEVLTVAERITEAHAAGKIVLVHADLAEGIGKDRAGLRYLAKCGADGILTTKAQLIRYAKELDLIAVQRFFVLDSRGMESIDEMLRTSCPHLMEIMPGVIGKAIVRFSEGPIPVIAGGLLQTKAEVTDALRCGATAVSTGDKQLWYI